MGKTGGSFDRDRLAVESLAKGEEGLSAWIVEDLGLVKMGLSQGLQQAVESEVVWNQGDPDPDSLAFGTLNFLN